MTSPVDQTPSTQPLLLVGEKQTIHYKEVIKNAFDAIKFELNSPSSKPLRLLKWTIGVPAFIALCTLSTAIVALVALYQIAMIPFVKKESIKLYMESTLNELFSIFIMINTFPVQLSRKAPLPNRSETPLLLVHGFMHNSSAWTYQQKELEQHTGPIYTISLGSQFHSIEEYAEKVRLKAAAIQKETGRNDLILVGHSMGGLVCAEFESNNREMKASEVKALITLGTPFKGTVVANIGLGKCAKQMRYQSLFTQNLNKKIQDAPPSLHIGSQPDQIVIPFTSAFPKHDKATYKLYNNSGHATLLYSDTVTQEILKFLRTI